MAESYLQLDMKWLTQCMVYVYPSGKCYYR